MIQADFYSHGDSERIIGKALKKYSIPRENVTILTKCYFGVSHNGDQLPLIECVQNDGSMVNRVGLSRKHIFDAVDASVSRLGTYIDLLQIHRLDRDTPMEEIMRALNDVVQSGKVRYIGASSVSGLCDTLENDFSHLDIDGCVGVPKYAKYRRKIWLAFFCQHAELCESDLSRRRT